MRYTTLLALLIGVMLYLVMGALVFRTLEAPKEITAYQDLLKTKEKFLDNKSCLTEQDLKKLVKGMMSAVDAGLDVSSLSSNFTSRWDWASSIFFCGTIITTIGFGNLSPRTLYGQLFCVCYALVGIPMFGILLAGVSDHMGTVLRRAVGKIETLFLKRMVRPTTVRVISAVLSILIGCLIFLAVPTVVFQKVESWSFPESLYFVVITLTTVGFGDYVPGDGREDDVFFKPLVWLWIVFGLAYFASILTMIGNWLRVLSKRTRAEMEELRAHATEWTENIQNMSVDLRALNPLEYDPFLLQRRRWKRSERRRIRRGAHGTVGYWVPGSENGHLPSRWAGLSSSMSQLNGHSTLERAAVVKSRPLASPPEGGGIPGIGPGIMVDPNASLQEARSFPHVMARSFSLPVAQSDTKLDCADEEMQDGSLSGSPYDSGSDCSSVSSVFLALHQFQPCYNMSTLEKQREKDTEINTTQEKDHFLTVPAEKRGSISNSSCIYAFTSDFCACSTPLTQPFIHSALPEIILPSPPLNTAASASCQLLDFFGENLAYIDESSDALSDRSQSEEKKKWPRKSKRRSMRRQLSQSWSSLQLRRPTVDSQPPSHPPTPPPDFSLSDMSPAEKQTHAATEL